MRKLKSLIDLPMESLVKNPSRKGSHGTHQTGRSEENHHRLKSADWDGIDGYVSFSGCIFMMQYTRTTETTETQILSSSWNPSKHQEAAQMVSMAGTISETSVPGRRKPRRIKSLAIS